MGRDVDAHLTHVADIEARRLFVMIDALERSNRIRANEIREAVENPAPRRFFLSFGDRRDLRDVIHDGEFERIAHIGIREQIVKGLDLPNRHILVTLRRVEPGDDLLRLILGPASE